MIHLVVTLLVAAIAPKSGAAMCALTPADFQAAGVAGAGKPTANVQDAGAGAYCVYAGKSSATGGIELDVFYPAGANAGEVKATYVTAMRRRRQPDEADQARRRRRGPLGARRRVGRPAVRDNRRPARVAGLHPRLSVQQGRPGPADEAGRHRTETLLSVRQSNEQQKSPLTFAAQVAAAVAPGAQL